jgi:hypothetical protein
VVLVTYILPRHLLDFVVFDDDFANVQAVVACKSDFTVQRIFPRFEEMFDNVHNPCRILVKLLSAVLFDAVAIVRGNPLAPESRLRRGIVVVIYNGIFPEAVLTFDPRWAIRRRCGGVVLQLFVVNVPLHVARVGKLRKVLGLVLGKRLIELKLVK